ncbi:hypothetical protein CI238_00991 [Colletotrichum incanum]|uniref:Uncharacterized protein n=1 Tax=Colletotrichum incanum TaxID=1573173 RepID=A0A166Q390_COLIC|nr:hypothetical protein CI238_00991 [Colletotrichum incanum]OHW91249.1 hypothetical protein CSPAE12_10240 [Colletotrichum incanum]
MNSPLLDKVAHADPQINVNNHQTFSGLETKPKKPHSVAKSDPLLPKLQYIQGFPILPPKPRLKTTTNRKRTPRTPSRPKPKPPAQPSKLQYIDGLPVLPKTDAEFAASRATQPPVYFRGHTPGKCLHCTLTSSPCTFTRGTSSAPCGRCRRLGQVCMIRRPGTANRIVTGEGARDWVPVQRAVERGLREDGARALAERVIREVEDEGRRVVFGDRLRERDIKGWCLPKVVEGGNGGDEPWKRGLRRQEEAGKGTKEVGEGPLSEAVC